MRDEEMLSIKESVPISEVMRKGEGNVTIRGWVHRERGSNKLRFIILRDSTEKIQCVIDKTKIGEAKFATADKLQMEASLIVTGTIKKDERAPTGYEIDVDNFKIIGHSDNFPISKDFSEEFLLDVRHLWLRSTKMTSIMKIRSTIFGAIHEYFREQGFYEHQSPIFMSSQAEGGSTLFSVDYFGKELYLAQTWQLHAEAMIFALENIYCIAPSFRAEKSKTSRHLTEYWHAEMEMTWCEFKDIKDHGERLIKKVVKKVLEKNKKELEDLKRDITRLETVVKKDFIRMTYDDALHILKEKCKMEIPWGKDLRTTEEERLTELYDVPIIVSNYPKKVKAFYMREVNDNPDLVEGCDFLAPEGNGEIIGGSQREHDIDKIKQRLQEEGENISKYDFYLDTRRYGSVPHGGFGLGVERLVKWICGLDNIKDAIAFPRTMQRYYP
ncbi:MAG: asparagine--tRNA ligase [Candidatus Woesearchaeota archaeon]